EDERVDNRLMKLENGIGKLIDLINDFRNELPRPKMKKLRKLLKGTKRNIATHGKKELEDILEIVFLVLMSVGKSKSEKLLEAQDIAFKLWKNFPNY
ncbi:MAG: hypothetical protein KAS17_05890, partial [Victivallaceae bacterium]|nr:hypothetical protein [Victivallaceae bacterium]